MKLLLSSLALAWLALGPSRASAQACAPGRVVGETTGGHCCWPAQSWSDEQRRCIGVPACPVGWGGDGERCAALDDDPVLRATERERGPTFNLVAGSLALFVTSYGPAIPLGVSLVGGRSCADAALAYLVPFGSIAGGPMLLACDEHYAPLTAALGLAFGVGQLVAVALFALGVTPRARAPGEVAWRGDTLEIAF